MHINLRSAKAPPSRNPPLTAEDEVRLIAAAQKGNQKARDELVMRNMGLITNCAHSVSLTGSDIQDLIAAGVCGCIKAIDKFDLKTGYRFITLAVWYVRQEMFSEAYAMSLPMSYPSYVWQAVGRAKKKGSGLSSLMEEIDRAEDGPTVKKSAKDLSSAVFVSIHSDLGGDSKMKFEEVIPDLTVFSVEEMLNDEDVKESVVALLSTLEKREALIVRMMYGIGMPTHTLEDAGRNLNISRQRIQQIKELAVTKLRKRLIMKNLKGEDSCILHQDGSFALQ